MEIHCISNLEVKENTFRSIYRTYEQVEELEFEISGISLDEEVFVCVDLCDESVYIHRDDLKIQGNRFSIPLEYSFADAIKDLSDNILENYKIKLSFQVEFEIDSNFTVIRNELFLRSPWDKSNDK
ncbi:MAG: hypothetical protein GY827_06360 [Cytophagales bacterium]|nr:hypothetical protein [Cytophagales bacterium]